MLFLVNGHNNHVKLVPLTLTKPTIVSSHSSSTNGHASSTEKRPLSAPSVLAKVNCSVDSIHRIDPVFPVDISGAEIAHEYISEFNEQWASC